ncbi:MAG: hypothetical protein R3248_14305 [Candidatus Promineifilaceae bacterium]|nr:hypothetical protein [Candidatus Promineifilaceae bacterium]
MYDVILAQSRPREVRVLEQYVYDEKITGVRTSALDEAEGRIVTTIPYYGRGHVEEGAGERAPTAAHSFGHLYVREYGLSRLNREPVPSLDQNRLWLNLNSNSREFEQIRAYPLASFDIRLAQEYSPEAPPVKPLEIEVEMLDEDEARDEEAWAEELRRQDEYEPESVEAILVRQAKNLISFKRSLIFRFRLTLRVPARLAAGPEDEVEVERVALAWPIATSPRLARVQGNPSPVWAEAALPEIGGGEEDAEGATGENGAGPAPAGASSRRRSDWPLVYDPENRVIEWRYVPFYPLNGAGRPDVRVYRSEPFQLEVDHPGQLYLARQLEGSITVRLRGSLSGLELRYVGPSPLDLTEVPIRYETTVVNLFRLHLGESFDQRYFSPQQHLQFPGIILDDMRVADVLMLLKDKRFELKREDWLQREVEGDGAMSQYLVEAERPEGTGTLHLWLLIQGTPAKTERERQTLGEAKYTTELSTGRTVIYMRGRLRGDSQRVVAVMNELQAQLKDHFRHVGTVD